MLFASNIRRNIDLSSGFSNAPLPPKNETARFLCKKHAQLQRRHTYSVITVPIILGNPSNTFENHGSNNKEKTSFLLEPRRLSNSRGSQFFVIDLNKDQILVFDTLKLSLAPDRRMSSTNIPNSLQCRSSTKISKQGSRSKLNLLQETTSNFFKRSSRSNVDKRSLVLNY